MKKSHPLSSVFFCHLVASLVVSAAYTQPMAQKAEQILNAAGIRGSLVVHLGCGDGRLTAALHANDSYIVQGLNKDAPKIDETRKHICSLNVYGPVSVDRLESDELPYIDNFVNLIVAEDLGDIGVDEVMRVLAPHGAAYIKKAGAWQKTIKPRPKEIDEWTHYLHDATGNAVAHDSLVGPPLPFKN